MPGKKIPMSTTGFHHLSLNPPHANLSTILSQLFNDPTQQKLDTFVTDPVIVNKVSQHLNGLAQLLQSQQRFHFQPSLKPPSSTTSLFRSEPHQNCSPPAVSLTNETIDQKIQGLCEACQEDTDNVPSTKSLLSPIKSAHPASVTQKSARNFFFDSGITNSSSWSELLSCQIQGCVAKRTLLTHAFDAHSIHKITCVRSKHGKTT